MKEGSTISDLPLSFCPTCLFYIFVGQPFLHAILYTVSHPCFMSSVSMWAPWKRHSHKRSITFSKKSPTGPAERTPKPEYVILLGTYLGVRSFWVSLFVFFEPGKIRSTARWFSRRDPTWPIPYLEVTNNHNHPVFLRVTWKSNTPKRSHVRTIARLVLFYSKPLVTGCIYIYLDIWCVYIYIYVYGPASLGTPPLPPPHGYGSG